MTDIGVRLMAALAGRYRVGREIGSGGAAIVFEARDLKHDRDVALKALRPEVTSELGADRFVREIRISASLFHPHILPLLDSGEANGLLYYVMPLVRGESLRSRLEREPMMPIPEALQCARECADAVAFAHSQDIIHRDIKPENILFEAGHATVADFGIARALDAAGGERLTTAGVAVGTPAYMSPEQASGESNVDARADIYSLAIVLFEMLAGRPPFQGISTGAIMAKHVTEAAPPVTRFRPDTPPHVALAVGRALEKDPARRFASATEFAAELFYEAPAAPRSRKRAVSVLAIAATLVVTALTLVLYMNSRSHAGSAQEARSGTASGLNRKLSQLTFATGVEQWPAWSRDGKRLAFVGEVGGYKKLFVRTLASTDERQITHGTGDDIQPTWAADGMRVAFVRARVAAGKLEPSDVNGIFEEGGDIWVVDIATARANKILDEAFDPAFSPDGRSVAFEARWSGARRIWIASAEGRNPRQVSNDSSEAVTHAEPAWSPDGATLVYRRIEKTASDLMTIDVRTQKASWVTHDNVLDLNPSWSHDGKSIYYASAGGGGLNVWRIGIGPDGAAEGPPVQLTTGAGDDINPVVSPDGGSFAFSVRSFDSDLWRLPVDPLTGAARGAPTSLISSTRVESRGSWSPDGQAIAFNSDRRGEMSIWVRTLATGTERQLTTGAGGDYQPVWSPDGQHILFFSARAGNADLWSIAVDGSGLRQLTSDRSMDTNPSFSPDGKRIAFMSDRRGRLEVWTMNPEGGEQRPVSDLRAGGHFINWSADGQSVVFRAETGTKIETVQVRVSDGTAMRLRDVSSGGHISWSANRKYMVDVKGHRTLFAYPLFGEPVKLFEFPEADARIDYPRLSPDGRWLLFDRAAPQGGDIWISNAN